jgi:hypothetical protein
MDDVDVAWGQESTLRGARGGRFARTSRKNDLRSIRFFLLHKPTGISVDGTIPEGHYSRAEMTKEREQLRATLWPQLERLVAKELRVPGR